jgi:quercetin dioxygenase-like cupin family protein
VVRDAEAKQRKGDGLIYTALSSGARFANLQPIRLTICADRVGDKRYQHEGEEWVYVLAGKVRLALGEKIYELAHGDAAHFDSRIPHRLSAIGGKNAEVIVVACPLPEALDPYPGQRIRQKRAIR